MGLCLFFHMEDRLQVSPQGSMVLCTLQLTVVRGQAGVFYPLLSRKLGDGLFLQCCREVAARYPQITFDSMIVDNTTMQVISPSGSIAFCPPLVS